MKIEYALAIFLIVIIILLVAFALIFANNYAEASVMTYKAESEPVAFWAEVTAYSEIDSCHYPNCIMSNGLPAQVGYIACPRSLKHGTIVEIDGLEYECGDRYNKNLSYRFDKFIGYGEESYEIAKAFGRQTLAVKIIEI